MDCNTRLLGLPKFTALVRTPLRPVRSLVLLHYVMEGSWVKVATGLVLG